jgi:acetylornithine deacetylase/succinyl-diaminopimelate desuccinylase family protein
MRLTAPDLSDRLDRARLISRLVTLVRTESENPPGNEARAGEVAAQMCEELGLKVDIHEAVPGRPNLVARWEGRPGPTLGYCSHLDVVPAGDRSLWTFDPYAAHIEDGKMFGRGSSDAKGPIAAALEAVAILKASGFEPRGSIELELVSDEESGGFKGTGYLAERGIIKPDIAIVGEPTLGRVVRAQRGIAWSRITTRGVAAHGSAPERGVNAIDHMAAIVRELNLSLPDITHPVVGGPTISIGTIHGGAKLNVIPASCVIEIDRRTIPGETNDDVIAQFEAAIERARTSHPGIDATVEIVDSGMPFEVDVGSPLVQTMATAAAEVTGKQPDVIGFRGASDARFLAEAGAAVIVFGPGDITVAHTAQEFIDLDDLEAGALAYALAFARLLGDDDD